MRTAEHRKPKPESIFGAAAVAILIGLVCGLPGAVMCASGQTTGLVLLAVAFSAFGAVTYLYRRED